MVPLATAKRQPNSTSTSAAYSLPAAVSLIIYRNAVVFVVVCQLCKGTTTAATPASESSFPLNIPLAEAPILSRLLYIFSGPYRCTTILAGNGL